MKTLILGANGMIGSAMLRTLSMNKQLQVIGAVRNNAAREQLAFNGQIVLIPDLGNMDGLLQLFEQIKPNVVINCVGLTKHLPEGNQPIPALTMNALLPHRLGKLCQLIDARLIHVSTDCVFSGKKGGYLEIDEPDATDVYGKTKHLGEVSGPKLLTLRTSTIGHELNSHYGLLEWFLRQESCKGYKQAIFSGLPSGEFARIVSDVVIPNENLSGLYHVGASPIDKDSLLRLIADVYQKKIIITPELEFSIDRSLNSELFRMATGYSAPEWPTLIDLMYRNKP